MEPRSLLAPPRLPMPAGFSLLMAAQFTSSWADNALLLVTMALLQEQGWPAWWAPLLKFAFTLSYVLLAPVAGPLADAMPKARLMAWMNALKLLGVMGLLVGVHPLLAFAVVGLGAAGYAPAKYGLVTELVPGPKLVVANSWIEISMVGAALLGAVGGGGLLSAWWCEATAVQALRQGLRDAGLPLDSAFTPSLVLLWGVYGLAAALQSGVPDSGARYAQRSIHPVALWRDFVHSNRLLWRDPDGGLSLAVTTLFWGVGATLQFAVLRWAQEALTLPLNQAAYLQAVVAVGVVVGAGLAGHRIGLHQARRVLPLGVLLGGLIALIACTDHFLVALALLAVVGAVGGLLVVPMNALLQHRGHTLLTAGRSIAVQGYNENLSILVMLAAYAGLLAWELPVLPLMAGFGLTIALCMALLWQRSRRLSATH